MQWAMRRLTPLVSRLFPGLYAVSADTLRYVLLALTLAVVTWAGRRFYINGAKALRHRAPDMNSLVAVGTGAALVYSVVATFWPALFSRGGMTADVYYEAVIIIIAGLIYSRMLVFSGLVQEMISFITGLKLGPLGLLLLLSVVYVILGCIMDGISMRHGWHQVAQTFSRITFPR